MLLENNFTIKNSKFLIFFTWNLLLAYSVYIANFVKLKHISLQMPLSYDDILKEFSVALCFAEETGILD